MRIVYVVHKFPPESLGGTEIYTWSLARHLAALGHEAHVFYPQANLSRDEVCIERDGVHLWRAALPDKPPFAGAVGQFWRTFRNKATEKEFWRFLSQVQPDLVHFQHVQGVSARLIPMAAGRPRVLTLHDYWYFCANSQLIKPDRRICEDPARGWACVDCGLAKAEAKGMRFLRPVAALPFVYRNRYLRRVTQGIDLFVAPSDFVRRQYIRQGFPRDRIITLPHGLDMERIAPSGVKLGPPPSRPHFGYLGAIAWQKGLHILIEAFNQLPDCASLIIYGDDRAFPEYTARLKAAVRHPHVRLMGVLDYRHIGDALRQLDYLVVPSIWFETFCLVIQEAYGVGVPAVASRLGALEERVCDGETGRLFAPGDSSDLTRVLRELIEHPEMRATFAANIRPCPTMQAHTKYLLEIYQGLRKGRRLLS